MSEAQIAALRRALYAEGVLSTLVSEGVVSPEIVDAAGRRWDAECRSRGARLSEYARAALLCIAGRVRGVGSPRVVAVALDCPEDAARYALEELEVAGLIRRRYGRWRATVEGMQTSCDRSPVSAAHPCP